MDDAEYAELEAQWTPLLHKFAGWPIAGMDREDIMQEMRIVLLNCQRLYNKDKNIKFMTLLYGSCLKIMLNLLRDSGSGSKPYMKYVPASMLLPLCEGEHSLAETCENWWCTAQELKNVERKAEGLSDLDLVTLFGHMSNDAKWLIGLITREKITTWTQDKESVELHRRSSNAKITFKSGWNESPRRRANKMMGADAVRRGLDELKLALRGGVS